MKKFVAFKIDDKEYASVYDVMEAIALDEQSLYQEIPQERYSEEIAERIDQRFGEFELFGTSYTASEIATDVCPSEMDNYVSTELEDIASRVELELLSMMEAGDTNQRHIDFVYDSINVTAYFEDDNILSKDIYVLVIIKDGEVVFHDYFNDIDSTYKMKEYFIEEHYASLGLPETDYATKENIIRKIGYSFNNLPIVVSFDPETDK